MAMGLVHVHLDGGYSNVQRGGVCPFSLCCGANSLDGRGIMFWAVDQLSDPKKAGKKVGLEHPILESSFAAARNPRSKNP